MTNREELDKMYENPKDCFGKLLDEELETCVGGDGEEPCPKLEACREYMQKSLTTEEEEGEGEVSEPEEKHEETEESSRLQAESMPTDVKTVLEELNSILVQNFPEKTLHTELNPDTTNRFHYYGLYVGDKAVFRRAAVVQPNGLKLNVPPQFDEGEILDWGEALFETLSGWPRESEDEKTRWEIKRNCVFIPNPLYETLDIADLAELLYAHLAKALSYLNLDIPITENLPSEKVTQEENDEQEEDEEKTKEPKDLTVEEQIVEHVKAILKLVETLD